MPTQVTQLPRDVLPADFPLTRKPFYSGIAGKLFPTRLSAYAASLPSSATHDYAEDFLNIFKALNWNVDNNVEVRERLPESPSGLALLVKENRLPPSAEALRDALRIYSVEAEITTDHQNLCGSRNFVLAVTRPDSLFAGLVLFHFLFHCRNLHALFLDLQPQPRKYVHINIRHPHQRKATDQVTTPIRKQ